MTVVFWSTPEPMWLYLTRCTLYMTISYVMPSEGSKVKHIQLKFPALLYMSVISLDSLNLSTIFCTVLRERPNLFAILHCKMWFLICLTLLSWNLAQSDFACKDWGAHFILKHDTLTYYQFTCLLWTVSKQFNVDISINVSLLFCLCPNFFGMCCNSQKLNLKWKLWKSFLCTFVN